MRDDEFNYIKITNEGENPDFEYGATPSSETTSYSDNGNRFRDEVNDNPHSNNTNKKQQKEKERKQEEEQLKKQEGNSSNNESHSSSSSSSSSAASSGASGGAAGGASGVVSGAVVGATLVSVVALSALVGINLYIQASCLMKRMDVNATSLRYELELKDIGDNNFIIALENETYKQAQELVEGDNEGYFRNLNPGTTYNLTVADVSDENLTLYSEKVTTSSEGYTITFISNGGSPVESQFVEAGNCADRPEDPTREGYTFIDWHTNEELTSPYTFEEIVTSDLTLYAEWLEGSPSDYAFIYFDSNGGIGSMDPLRVRIGTEYYLPEVWGIEAPYGYTFDPVWWLVDGESVENSEPLIIEHDITIANAWAEAAMIYYDANGGTGEMEPERTTDSYLFPECRFVGQEYFNFDYWMYSSDEGEANEEHFLPGDEYYFKPRDRQGNITVITIFPIWKPDAELSMYINYIDTLSPNPTNLLSFNYTKTDEHSIFSNYILQLSGSVTMQLNVGALEDSESYVTKTVEVNSEDIGELGTGIVNYTMIGTTGSGDNYPLAYGSLSMTRSQKNYYLFAYIGDTALQEDCSNLTFPAYIIDATSSISYYVPVRFDYADYNKTAHGSSDWGLTYSVDGSTETNMSFNYSGGVTGVSISSSLFDADTKSATFSYIYFKDGSGNMMGTKYYNVTLQASDELYVGGFQLNLTKLMNPSSNPTFSLAGCGEKGANPDDPTENYTYKTLGVNDSGFEALLYFRVLEKSGYIVRTFTIDVLPYLSNYAYSSITTTNVEFEFNEVSSGSNEQEAFIEIARHYVVDVELSITTASGKSFTCLSYESYSFR